jgi:hypothetical protein
VPVSPHLVSAALPDPERFARKRTLWLSREIDDALSGVAGISDFFDPRFGALVERYIAGLYVTGSMQGDPRKLGPDFERLLNVDEVWVMCFRAPRFNQWRVMGRFIAHNEFVGLALYQRRFLDGEHKYQGYAEAFVSHWANSLPRAPIFRGSAIEDYISKPVRDPYAPSIL